MKTLSPSRSSSDLAVQCIAARAEAEDILRLIRQNAHDIGLEMRRNAWICTLPNN